jgi:hypothetical protein
MADIGVGYGMQIVRRLSYERGEGYWLILGWDMACSQCVRRDTSEGTSNG